MVVAVIDKIQSERIWALKAFSIISVFFAHMPWKGDCLFMCKLYALLGIAGVPIFYFLSGYLNAGKEINRRRIFFLVVPVLIWGSFSFFLSKIILHAKFDFSIFFDLILYLIGSKSIYYFVSVLLFCLFIQKYINEKVLLVISLISIIFGYNFIPHNEIFTRYLNPFNFIAYFELGILARKYNWRITRPNRCIIGGAGLCVTSWFLFGDKLLPNYFSIGCLVLFVGSLLLLNGILSYILNRYLIFIGQVSFVIYLIHISFAGYFNARFIGFWGEIFKVILSFWVVLIIVYVMDLATSKIRFLAKIRQFIGFR